MWLLNPYRFGTALDANAAAYIAAVEAADGQALEAGVRTAINAFVVGCKADGIWNAIKASCIMAGARTLNGALRPLVGPAPTNFNFVAGDYNRKTGLVGNGSTKILDTNRNNNADPQNNKHVSIYTSSIGSSNMDYMGVASRILFIVRRLDTPNNIATRLNNTTSSSLSNGGIATGFVGMSRSVSTSHQVRFNAANTTVDSTSVGLASENIRSSTDARLAFYSIGEALDLAMLDARVTALINAFAAAIP